MLYRIAHTTTYRYPMPVSVCHNTLILSPRTDGRLRVENHKLAIRPTPVSVIQRTDMFGNAVRRFSLEENHSQLTITATSRVEVIESPITGPAPTCGEVADSVADRTDAKWLEAAPFVFDSPRIRRSDSFKEYAAPSLRVDRPILDAVRDLTTRVHQDFEYDKSATHVDTSPEEAFQVRRGVCQDFAQVAVACLRSHRVPARYISGYLRTQPPPGKERLVGADQSHAWLAIYAGPDLGWVEFDPTNDCLCGVDHIPLAFGRDYGDVVPIKGVFLGGGDPQLSVAVDVAPIA